MRWSYDELQALPAEVQDVLFEFIEDQQKAAEAERERSKRRGQR